ncbi:4-coumarate-- ligase [Fusarium albosuccineum]|uniref:4-coumarate-- ligase n=1 Tax=Fusarium albosuccineum TaxID=1237068 RepID=A0A8H4LBJ3_9HYPO|nr:4-coumarate-- ligase [Fusarium albosuccineum]
MPITSRWSIPLPQVSLPTWVFQSAQEVGLNHKVFIDADKPERFLTYSGYLLLSKRIALGLERAGLKHGDRVLLFSGNDVLYPAIVLGVMMAGGVFTGASPAFTSRELAYQLQDSAASFLITAPGVLDAAIEAAAQAGVPKSRVYLYDGSTDYPSTRPPTEIKHWTSILATADEAENFQWYEPSDPRQATCALNYSSGTTGKPKGVEITHFAYVANGETGIYQQRLHFEAYGEPYQGRALCFAPLCHAAAQTTYMANYPKLAISTYIMGSFNFVKMLEHIQNHKITELFTAPPIVAAMATSPLCAKYNLDSVKSAISGTAPLDLELAKRFNKLWPNGKVTLRQGWGMTELTCVGSIDDPRQGSGLPSIGEAAPNVVLKLMNEGKEVTEPRQRGELWVSTPTIMKGYWRNPKATEETLARQDGVTWLKTGDIAEVESFEPGAKIYIVDRMKELIKVKGFQVAPAELENLLRTREDVVDAGVVGVVIDGAEWPRAYVVKSAGSKVTEQEIEKWIDERVAKYKRLAGGVAFIDAIPRLQSGKMVRRVLKERAKNEVKQLKAKLA